ncbi:hypothetical protein MD484_g2282, partial [Candolleomyces efflorescens]
MSLKDFFKGLNCCDGSGIALDDHHQQVIPNVTIPTTHQTTQGMVPVAQSFDTVQRSTSLGHTDGSDSSGQAVHLFSNAQGFSIQNSRLNTSIYYADPHQEAIGLLLANSAPAASWNSKYRSFDTPKCDEDTRVGLVEEIMTWATSDQVPSKLLCMTGSAGSGKSALAQTVSETCVEKGHLGASFFFSVADPQRNNPDLLIGSLAYQISQCVDGVGEHIDQAVVKDPAIFKMSMEHQAKVLLIDPTLKAGGTSKGPWVIVIDGLDECSWGGRKEGDKVPGEGHQAQVLRVLQSCVRGDLPFRIFVTSRPEHAIRSALAPLGHLSDVYHIMLNEHDATADIRLYLHRRLGEIGKAKGDGHWPSEDMLDILVEGASGQFIFAATVVKFIADRRRSRNPQVAYEEVSGPHFIRHIMSVMLLRDAARHRDVFSAGLAGNYAFP